MPAQRPLSTVGPGRQFETVSEDEGEEEEEDGPPEESGDDDEFINADTTIEYLPTPVDRSVCGRKRAMQTNIELRRFFWFKSRNYSGIFLKNSVHQVFCYFKIFGGMEK